MCSYGDLSYSYVIYSGLFTGDFQYSMVTCDSMSSVVVARPFVSVPVLFVSVSMSVISYF